MLEFKLLNFSHRVNFNWLYSRFFLLQFCEFSTGHSIPQMKFQHSFPEVSNVSNYHQSVFLTGGILATGGLSMPGDIVNCYKLNNFGRRGEGLLLVTFWCLTFYSPQDSTYNKDFWPHTEIALRLKYPVLFCSTWILRCQITDSISHALFR